MKRYIIIGIAGVVVILIAVVLNFWLTPGDEDESSGVPPVALAPEPEPTPAPMPATDMPAAPVAEPDVTPPGGPVAVPDSAAERPPTPDAAPTEPTPPVASAPAPTAPAPPMTAPTPPPIPAPRGVVTAPAPPATTSPPAPTPPQTATAPTPTPQAPKPEPPTPAAAPAPPPIPAPRGVAKAPLPPATPAPPAPTPPTSSTAPAPAPVPRQSAAVPADEPKVAVLPPPEVRAPAAIRPTFDVVRVTPGGETVIAGRATPGSVVTVYDGGRPIGEVRADARGEWVLVPDTPLPPGSRELTVSARAADGALIWSDSVVVVVVPEKGRDIAGRAAEEASEPLVVEVPRTGFGASNVLQQPQAADPGGAEDGEAGFELTVTVLDYDSAGNLSLTGRARAGSDIRVYLDNGLLGHTPSDADGNWRLTIKREVAPGLYTMRVDEVAGDAVVARLEFPFSRADPREIESGPLLVVVQPGNSLWRLARRTLGEGVRYTVIYAANRDRIRDPDLIYPGQIIQIPQTN